MQQLVICVKDNEIVKLIQFNNHDKAIEKAIDIAKDIYNKDSVDKFIKRNNLEKEGLYSIYHKYFRSEEYLHQNENASIEIIGIELL